MSYDTPYQMPLKGKGVARTKRKRGRFWLKPLVIKNLRAESAVVVE